MTAKERPPAPYVAIPRSVLQCPEFQSVSRVAQLLLVHIADKHDGRNNGHITIPHSWLADRGFAWGANTHRCLQSLLKVGLLVRTRLGEFERKPACYALAWLPISDSSGLKYDEVKFNDARMRFSKLRCRGVTDIGDVASASGDVASSTGDVASPNCTKNRQFIGDVASHSADAIRGGVGGIGVATGTEGQS